MRTILSVTVYLFRALYGSTTLQSQSFLKNIENFLCKQKLVNNCSILSTHAERIITVHSHIHSFTPYPSFSPYWQTDKQRDKYTHWAWAGGTFFLVVLLCQFFVLAGNRFWFYSNYNQKKRYSHLAVGWNKSQITICRVKIWTPPITL